MEKKTQKRTKSRYKVREDGKYDTGRPTVFTQEVLQKLDLAYSVDSTDEEACIFANISPSSLYNYQNENPEFLERKRLLKQKPILKARINVKEALEDKDIRVRLDTSKWLLERKRKDEFSTKEETVVMNLDVGKADLDME